MTGAGKQPRGRPRRRETDAAILQAAVDVVMAVGVQGMTMTAVARRAGVARATVYLRWPTRSALIGGVARAAIGGRSFALTGTFGDDVRAGAALLGRAMQAPTIPTVLPEILRALLADPPELVFGELFPRRRDFANLYAGRARAEGLDPELDPNLAFDMLLGTAIARLMATRHAPTADESSEIAGVVLRGLEAHPAPRQGVD